MDLLSKSEYYPYGMVIEELSYNLSKNRYGFGGTHEMDNEVKGGVGNHLSFGDFGYDTRVARRFNIDPIDQIFISNYAGFGNNPIFYSDPTGYTYCESCEDVTPQEYDVAAEIAIDEGIKSIEKSVDNALNKIFDISTSIINSVYVGGQSYGSWSNLGSPEPYAVKNRKIDGSVATGKEVLLSTVETTLMVTPLPKVGRISQYFSMPGTNAVVPGTNSVLRTSTAEVLKETPTIVGEGMLRVSTEAAKHSESVILNNMPKFAGAPHQITSQMMIYNRQWLLKQMKSGRPIIDIGLDPNRGVPSIFYQMEQNMIKNYLQIHPNAFQLIKK